MKILLTDIYHVEKNDKQAEVQFHLEEFQMLMLMIKHPRKAYIYFKP